MRGRAGRKGKDEIGETYLCCEKRDLEAMAELLEAEMPSIGSCMAPEKRGIKRFIFTISFTFTMQLTYPQSASGSNRNSTSLQ